MRNHQQKGSFIFFLFFFFGGGGAIASKVRHMCIGGAPPMYLVHVVCFV